MNLNIQYNKAIQSTVAVRQVPFRVYFKKNVLLSGFLYFNKFFFAGIKLYIFHHSKLIGHFPNNGVMCRWVYIVYHNIYTNLKMSMKFNN